ncbi:MAG: Phenylserine dehydratase [Alphaproteobacteria bacterium MarineAlpha5_Bin9]|nr:MAG: Phenylserine dehydratase [Alphaproteobacteria bacterium MarineAlpha5_Bin9]|tara:strand:- start:1791 stop:2762 length:972 start_codon:yes stop_codon:yes gene_type:complete
MIDVNFSVKNIQNIKKMISPYILNTPIIHDSNNSILSKNRNLFFKLEFLQNGGSFKSRGAINNVLSLNKKEKKNGVLAVSAGNHAISVAYASNILKVKNKVIMLKSSNEYRRKTVRQLGSKLIIAKNAKIAFDKANIIAKKENRFLIHPFDGVKTLQGSATLGLEICQRFNKLDNLIISVGGGGLIAGTSIMIKQKFPNCKIIGVEPKEASGLTQSLKAGRALNSVKVNTIADSLGPPYHMKYSFDICKNHIDEMILISDHQMKRAMKFVYNNYKFILEPAACAGIAALQGPLSKRLLNETTLVLLCGSNIDLNTWFKLAYDK